MKVLVTGASGYVGSRLVPLLLERDHEVVAGFSTPNSADRFWWADRVRPMGLDVLEADTVRRAVEGVDAVYYLVHGLGGEDFVATDRLGARHVAEAVAAAGVRRVVYLSGIVPRVPAAELSDHITSRLEVERVLTGSGVPTLSLRAAVLLGSGSTSFEIIRQISERLPVQTVPAWMRSDVQPIAVVDALAALVGALALPAGTASRSYDISGPERPSYPELLQLYAEVAGIARPQLTLPGLPSSLVGSLAGRLTDVPSATVSALMESLRHDMVCGETDFLADLVRGRRLLGVRESLARALAPAPAGADPATLDPMGPLPSDPAWAAGGADRGAGFLLAKGVAALDAVTGTRP